MEIISFFMYLWFTPVDNQKLKYQTNNIIYNENIDYCSNIIHDPNKIQEFFKNCDLQNTNKHIMKIKNWN